MVVAARTPTTGARKQMRACTAAARGRMYPQRAVQRADRGHWQRFLSERTKATSGTFMTRAALKHNHSLLPHHPWLQAIVPANRLSQFQRKPDGLPTQVRRVSSSRCRPFTRPGALSLSSKARPSLDHHLPTRAPPRLSPPTATLGRTATLEATRTPARLFSTRRSQRPCSLQPCGSPVFSQRCPVPLPLACGTARGIVRSSSTRLRRTPRHLIASTIPLSARPPRLDIPPVPCCDGRTGHPELEGTTSSAFELPHLPAVALDRL